MSLRGQGNGERRNKRGDHRPWKRGCTSRSQQHTTDDATARDGEIPDGDDHGLGDIRRLARRLR